MELRAPLTDFQFLGACVSGFGLYLLPKHHISAMQKKCQLRGTSSAYVNWPQSNLQMGNRSQQFNNYTHRTLPKANNKRPLKETAIPCHSTPQKKEKNVVFQLSTTNLCAGVNFREGNCTFLHPIEARC